MRDVDLDGVVVVAHPQHDGNSSMNITGLQESLNVHTAELLLCGLSSNAVEREQHPVR
jgi:hypothetical protein